MGPVIGRFHFTQTDYLITSFLALVKVSLISSLAHALAFLKQNWYSKVPQAQDFLLLVFTQDDFFLCLQLARFLVVMSALQIINPITFLLKQVLSSWLLHSYPTLVLKLLNRMTLVGYLFSRP